MHFTSAKLVPDLLLNSELSIKVCETSSGKLIGSTLSCVWPVDYDYDAFEVDPKDWFNTAAEVAEVRGYPELSLIKRVV